MGERLLDAVIVGGGPAGLSAALELRDRDILLLEASSRLGGRLRSEPRGPYWLNLGGHLLPPAGSRIRAMLDTLGLTVVPIPGKKLAICLDGTVHAPEHAGALPFILPLSLSGRVSMARVGLRLMRAARGWRRALAVVPGESATARRERLAQFLSDRSFRDLIGPVSGRVDAIFAAAGRRAAVEIDEQAAGVGVSLFGAVWGGRGGPQAINLDGGSGRLAEAVAKAVGPRHIRLGAEVVEVAASGGQVRVSYRREGTVETVTARHAIVAVPAFVAARIVTALPDRLRTTLQTVQYGPFVSLGILTREASPMPWDDLYAVVFPEASFDMFFNHANPLRTGGTRQPGGSLMVYAGGRKARDLLERTDAEIEALFLADLRRAFPQIEGIVAETQVAKWNPGNASRSVGFRFDAMIDYCARADTAIHFAGDYFAEIGSMETAASSAHEAALKVRAQLPHSS
ncbi:MAG: FAD-dependent oxidoreductase [Rhizobiaceae bacterium]|nr:FAD-dependent oxidoreductase [Rhizobiaceae bacterium]